MLNELIAHSEREEQLAIERMRAVADVTKEMAETRRTLIAGDVDEDKKAVFEEVMHQLDNLRREADAEIIAVKSRSEVMRRVAGWVKPLENGYGYSSQFPKQAWDGFDAVLAYLPAADRIAIRSIPLSSEDLESDVVNVRGDVLVVAPASTTLGQWVDEFAPSYLYPRQHTPLHNRFVDEVFPKIAVALADKGERDKKERREALDRKLAVVKEMADRAK